MPAWYTTFESVVKLLAGIAGLGTLAFAVYHMLRAQQRPTGTTTGAADRLLRTPFLIISTIIFVVGGYLLWLPLPIQISWKLGLFLMIVGGLIFFPSLVLYVWGLVSLGSNFNASSGFGVRLVQSHQLVTRGPFSYVRHPMYLSVILAGWGGLLIYLTCTMLVFAVIMLGLIIRARREEQALAQEFGQSWLEYCQRVPGWIPRLKL